ncbi:MAG: DUF4185 domain-containing protein [Actinomycetota bacterium]
MKRFGFAAVIVLATSMALAPARAVETDPFQDRLNAYGNTGQGWTGGDGTYSVPLPDGRTAWIFSDTFLGTVNPDGTRPAGSPLVHNSIIVESTKELTTFVGRDTAGNPRALIDTIDGASWYWMGDGTVEDSTEGSILRIFVFRFVRVPGPLLFQQIGVDLAELSLPDMTVRSVVRMPQAFAPGRGGGPVSWGAAILERPDHTYVYGVEDLRIDKRMYVARTPPGNLRGPWEYWTGSGWSPLPVLAVPVLSRVANEMSVSWAGGRFVAVAQENSAGPNILAWDAPAPHGPFAGERVLFTTPEPDGNIFTYNAKAHPQRSAPGSLVVSYNVNSFTFADLFADVSIYRPRFIVVPMS